MQFVYRVRNQPGNNGRFIFTAVSYETSWLKQLPFRQLLWRCLFRMSGQEKNFILKFYVTLLSGSQANARIVPSFKLRLFHSSSFPINNSAQSNHSMLPALSLSQIRLQQELLSVTHITIYITQCFFAVIRIQPAEIINWNSKGPIV